jgi:hypothetical protein
MPPSAAYPAQMDPGGHHLYNEPGDPEHERHGEQPVHRVGQPAEHGIAPRDADLLAQSLSRESGCCTSMSWPSIAPWRSWDIGRTSELV